MGDRTQRAKGVFEEQMGKAKKKTGRATGSRSLQGKGGAEAIKGKVRQTVAKTSSTAKKKTR
jgi:uncharacterized protein YjbJ (UPF0337 family)